MLQGKICHGTFNRKGSQKNQKNEAVQKASRQPHFTKSEKHDSIRGMKNKHGIVTFKQIGRAHV